MDAEATVRAYYAALDDDRYGDLRDLLAPGFTQHRPDRTFDDREAFLSFMRTDRPHSDTTHVLDGVYAERDAPTETREVLSEAVSDDESATDHPPGREKIPLGETTTLFAPGIVQRENGDVVVNFVDRHDVLAGRIVAIETYTR